MACRAAAVSRAGEAPLLHELVRAAPAEAAAGMSEALRRRWQEMLGAEALERRLAWTETATAPDPAAGCWRDLLQAALADPAAMPSPGCLDLAAPLPFEEVLAPVAAAARRELERSAGAAVAALAPAALAGLERGLLALLCHLAAPVLTSEFTLARALAGHVAWLDRPASTDGYRRFVATLRAGGLHPLLLDDYPGLGRLLAATAHNWAAANSRLMTRLNADAADLRAAFGLSAGELRVDGAAVNCSDPHDGGQGVAILRVNGRLLVYKPRPVDMEDGLGELLGWANGAGFPWPFRPIGLLARPDHGWMEHVAAAPCADDAAVTRFYARSGGLFCLWWLLQGTDLHHENLIASGEHPVIIDAETLLHPRLFPHAALGLGPGARPGGHGDDDFTRALRDSGFLPSGLEVDLSCWGTLGGAATPFAVAHCRAANSDAMALERQPYRVAPRPNVPVLDGRPVPAAAHARTIVDGFAAMYRLVLRDRAGFAAVLDRFAGRGGRFVARATNAYGLLLNASLAPEWLREGPARGVLYEQLRRAAAGQSRCPPCWPLLDAELAALERLDVPRFVSRPDRPTPCWPAPLDQARARLATLSRHTLARHAAALRRALATLPSLSFTDEPLP